MSQIIRSRPILCFFKPSLALALTTIIYAQAPFEREFPVGGLGRIAELPAGRFRIQLEGLPPQAQGRALEWLQDFHFPAADVGSMHVDPGGGICYACEFGHTQSEASSEPAPVPGEPEIYQIAVPVDPFPESLKFHSRPGLTKRVYINFVGQTVSGTAWNTSLGRSSIVALPFNTDSDPSTFSDAEQAAIKRIWQRMAEDFAPFDIDVTTERPATINSTTAIVVVTRSTDANGDPNPASSAGGVAYVNVFGASNFISTYSPAWVYHNNLGNSESNIAEAASHEVGHNLGLSHDGTTTLDYYGGHGASSDQTSWGPLMGTGYGRNVSQWTKGEYLNASNTQDDLATIAAKTGYRTDDRGNTAGTAQPLVVSGGTSIISTTPENDPTNTNPANKGVIERNTDVDVFSFSTGAGTVSLNANPLVQPAGTRGGNLDILLELYNQSGSLVASSNPASLTTASISATVAQGVYYLHVKNSGAGNPLVSPPSGYTSYGAIGQYFISGTVVDPGGLVVAPVAESFPGDLTVSGQANHQFTVSYSDNIAINVATLGTGNVRVTGPGGYDQIATFVSVDIATNGTPRMATYSVSPAGGGTWTAFQNGTYAVAMVGAQVLDTENAAVPAGVLGQFQVAIPVPLYSANMGANPGWTLGTNWSFGTPAYGNDGPNSGFSGSNVIGHSMSSNYAKALPISYATTPLITNAGSSSSLTLRFRRWLGLKRDDTAIIQASGDNGTSWVTLWSSTANIADSSWQLVQYTLPQSLIGSTQLLFRWGLASISRNGNAPSAIGWHIDDVELLGGGALDASPPGASLSVANITQSGSPTHSCTVTFTDATAVLRLSVDITDLLVIGPAGALSPLVIESTGVDLPDNGTPMGANYSIVAPGGSWDPADNGTYTLTLQEGAVEDTLGNVTPEQILGSFSVNISILTPGVLVVNPPGDLVSSGNAGGSFSPSSLQYTLSNSGQTALDWQAEKVEGWVSLSSAGGTLGAGANTTVTVSINAGAASLAVGSYSDTVSFSNTTNNNGNTTRGVSLTVSSIPVTVTLGGLSQTYDGNPKPVTVTTDPASKAHSVTYAGSTVAPTNAGTYALVVTITEPGYTGSASGSLVIAKAAQTLSFAALAPVTIGTAPFALSATATSGLPAAFASSNTSVATVSGNTVSIVGVGQTTITASQSGDVNRFPAADVQQVLTVNSVYESWAGEGFAKPLTQILPGDDQDLDGLSNLLEFAFGTDPTIPTPGLLAYSGGTVIAPGQPLIVDEAGNFHAVFARRKDYVAAGLTYTPQFSADLSPDWTTSSSIPGPEATNGIIDAVKIPFPATVPTPGGDKEARFFRVGVTLSP